MYPPKDSENNAECNECYMNVYTIVHSGAKWNIRNHYSNIDTIAMFSQGHSRYVMYCFVFRY